MRVAALTLTLISLVLASAIAGFFYAYSVSVMPGLNDSAPEAAVRAMQGINRMVRNPVFFVTFFLTPAFTLVAAALAARSGARTAALALAGAAAVYLVGAVAPTAAVNVPMNRDLAGVSGAETDARARAIWSGYAPRWTGWNHLRTAASSASLVLVGLALFSAGRSGSTVP